LPTVICASKALMNPGQIYRVEEKNIEIEGQSFFGDVIRFEDVSLTGEMLGTETSVSIRGTITAKAVTRCARCLGEAVLPMEAEMDDVFKRQVDADDPDAYPFEGANIELNEAVKNALVLNLPYRIVCREDCKGLCPGCGKNLNEGSCTCQEGTKVMNPFSALKAIVENEEV